VIRPPVRITFGELGPEIVTDNQGTSVYPNGWGSFDGSTNPAIVYPPINRWTSNQCTVTLSIYNESEITSHYVWHLKVPIGLPVAFQISTNGVDWTTAAVVTNTAGIMEWSYDKSDNPLPLLNVIPVPIP
jgi:hypothetical protein